MSHYEELLRYISEKYNGTYGPTSPREVAQFYRKAVSPPDRKTRKKICMLVYSPYEADNRVRRYAETLVKRGDKVDVIAISSSHLDRQHKVEINGVTVYRVQGREHNERSKWTYAWRLLRFLVSSSRALTTLHEKNRYDVVHIHNMPDFLVFAAWYPKLTRAALILDIHDVVPELFANKFRSLLTSTYVSLLKIIEKLSARFVDHVIISNHLWYESVTERSIPKERCSVIVNHVDPELFFRRPKTRADDKFIILFPGSLQWHQGLDIAINGFAEIKRRVTNAELHIYAGSGGDQTVALRLLVQSLHLEESVKFYAGLPLDEIVQVIANANLGIVPKRADSFGNEAYSTKIMEFMSQGIPVVVSRTKVDSFYFEEGVVHFFPSGDSEAMAKAVLEVINDDDLREALISRGYEYCERNGWAMNKQRYLDLVDSLSSELFDDADPSISLKPAFRCRHIQRPATEASVSVAGGVASKFNVAESESLREENSSGP